MTGLERGLEARCVARIEALGGEALKLQLLGRRGWPDRTIFLPGVPVWFVEFKRPGKGRISVQQTKWHKNLRYLGHAVYIIDNDKDFDIALTNQS